MRYKVYYNGNLCQVFNNNVKYIWDMYTKPSGGGISVEEGGELELPNGDTLIIAEKNAETTYGGPGIQVSLDSGNEFMIWYYMVGLNQWQQSGYGSVCEYDEEDMYEEGNFMRVYYDFDGSGLYDEPYYSACWTEHYLGGIPFITLVIQDGEWVLVNDDPKYCGNSVTLNSGEEIWISNRAGSQWDGSIIYFTRSSGSGCYAYLKHDGDPVNHTSNFWLGLDCSLDDDTSITIYDYGDDDYNSAIDWSEDYTEENVSEYLNKLCVLYYDSSTNEWYIDEDYS